MKLECSYFRDIYTLDRFGFIMAADFQPEVLLALHLIPVLQSPWLSGKKAES